MLVGSNQVVLSSPRCDGVRMVLRIAFVNCHNLFQVGAHPDRFDGTQADLDRNTENLAATIRQIFPGALPHVVGLCEVGSRELGTKVGEAAEQGRFDSVWSGVPARAAGRAETGIMVLYESSRLLRTESEKTTGPDSLQARVKWMATEFQVRGGSRAPFWLVVNHWKSQLGGARKTEPLRMDSAREIGEFFLETARLSTEAMVLIGDFNCEPGDWPLREQRQQEPETPNKLKGVRERALVLRDRNRLAYFYNPMWRYLPEPEPWETARQPAYLPSRPLGTFVANKVTKVGWSLFDQVLVTKRCLAGGLLGLQETAVTVVEPVAGCSDHHAIGAVLEC